MAGLESSRGVPMRKCAGLWASHHTLPQHVAELQCDHSHEHKTIEGPETDRARLWPWGFAVAIGNGITDYVSG
eukprot:506026-Pyramimonas_sp.AAC.1